MFKKDDNYFRHKKKMIQSAMKGTHAKIRELQLAGAEATLIDAQCSYLASLTKELYKVVNEWWKWEKKNKNSVSKG